MTERLERKRYGEEICRYNLFRWAKNMKIIVLRVNAYQKVTLAEEELSKQVDRMMHSVDIHFFPKPSLSCFNGFMCKEAMMH